jgi:hypothetical protein
MTSNCYRTKEVIVMQLKIVVASQSIKIGYPQYLLQVLRRTGTVTVFFFMIKII